MDNYDRYFIQWWEKNKAHFEYHIEKGDLDDSSVHLICGIDHLLDGAKWEMNSTLVTLLHSFLNGNKFVRRNTDEYKKLRSQNSFLTAEVKSLEAENSKLKKDVNGKIDAIIKAYDENSEHGLTEAFDNLCTYAKELK